MSDYRRFAIAVFSALGLAALINLAYVLIGYIELGTYLDHAEPDTAIMAWRFANGEPLYYRPTDVEHIFTAYGPLLYIITGLPFQFLAPSIGVSKLASVLALGTSCILFGVYVWRRFGFGALGIGLTMFTFYPIIVAPVSFWVRPEAHMVLLVTIALLSTLASDKGKPWVSVIVIAVCAGLAMNQKVHAFIFFVPLVFRYCIDDWLRRWPVMAVISISALLLPFTLSNISLLNYIEGVAGMVGERSIMLAAVGKALKWTPIFLAPGALLLISHRIGGHRANREELVYLGVFTLAIIFTYYPSSAEGSTWRQMLPFYPIGIDLFLRFLGLQAENGRTWLIFSTVIVATIGAISVSPERRILRAYTSNSWGAEAGKDIRELMARYPEKSMQIGYGDGRQLGYPLTYLRPWLAFSGHPVTVSGPSTIERAFAGKPFPTLKINWIEACKTDFWLIDPKGKPFALDSFIEEGRAFPKEVELSFLRHYQKKFIYGHYQIWACKTGPEDPFF